MNDDGENRETVSGTRADGDERDDGESEDAGSDLRELDPSAEDAARRVERQLRRIRRETRS